MTTLGPFSALIFDQDGTLLDAESAHCRSWIQAAATVGVAFEETTFAHFAGKGDPAIARYVAARAAGDRNAEDLVADKRAIYRRSLPSITLNPGALEFLERCRGVGLPLAMATISPAAETATALRACGLQDFFQAVVTRESADPRDERRRLRSKPAPDIYLAAAQALRVAPAQCCAFEDSLTGVQAALAAGMTVVALPTRYSRTQDLSMATVVVGGFGVLSVDPQHCVHVARSDQ